MGAPLSSSGMPRGHCESIVWTQYSITSRDLVLSRLLSLSALQLSILRAQIRNRAAVRRTSRLNSPVGPGGKRSQQPRLSSVITRCGPNRCQQPEDGGLLIKKARRRRGIISDHRRRGPEIEHDDLWTPENGNPCETAPPKSLKCRLHPPKAIDRTDPSVAAHLPPARIVLPPRTVLALTGAQDRGTARHCKHTDDRRQGRGVSPSAALARGPGKPASVGVWGDDIRGDIERLLWRWRVAAN